MSHMFTTRQTAIQSALIGSITVYRRAISPFLPRACRFYPSCSAYAVEAIAGHGAARGLWLAARRLFRCHPWCEGGVDPVPHRATHAHGCELKGRA